MGSLDTFKKRMSATSGASIRDEMIKNSKLLLQSTFLDDASFNPYISFWKTNIKLVCRIWGRKKSSNLVISTIQTFIDATIMVGDIIYDSNDKEYWMCTNLFNIDDVHKQGELTLCNYMLKFQATDGTILSYPCINSTSSNIGIDVGNTITVGNSVHTIKLPFDDNTKLIKVDRRFFIDKFGTTTYAVTNVNNTEFNYGDKGLVVLTMKADGAYNSQVDKNGVCNYFEPVVTPTPNPSPTGYVLTIVSNGDFNLGTTRTLTPTLKDSLGNVVSAWAATWTVDYNGMDTSWFAITYTGNQCVVKISEDAYDCIDRVLKLTCTVDVNTVSTSYSGTITA